MAFIAGAYTATFDPQPPSAPVTLGVTQSGFTIEQTLLGQPITADNLGDAVQDGVYTGANFFLEMILQEWSLAMVQDLFWPVDIAQWGKAGHVGRLWSALTGQLVLTDTDNTPAAGSPATLTAPKALLAPNFPIQHVLNTKLRSLPIRMMLLPTIAGAEGTEDTTWFTVT